MVNKIEPAQMRFEEIVSKFRQIENLMGRGCPVLMRSGRSALLNKPIAAVARNEPLQTPMVRAQRRTVEPRSTRRRDWIIYVHKQLKVSERLAYRVLKQNQSTQKPVPQGRTDKDRLA